MYLFQSHWEDQIHSQYEETHWHGELRKVKETIFFFYLFILFFSNSYFLQIAGGSGITPMLQVIEAILKNPNDNTKVSMFIFLFSFLIICDFHIEFIHRILFFFKGIFGLCKCIPGWYSSQKETRHACSYPPQLKGVIFSILQNYVCMHEDILVFFTFDVPPFLVGQKFSTFCPIDITWVPV